MKKLSDTCYIINAPSHSTAIYCDACTTKNSELILKTDLYANGPACCIKVITCRKLTVSVILHRQWKSSCSNDVPLNSALRNSQTRSIAMLWPIPPRRFTVRLWTMSWITSGLYQPDTPVDRTYHLSDLLTPHALLGKRLYKTSILLVLPRPVFPTWGIRVCGIT